MSDLGQIEMMYQREELEKRIRNIHQSEDSIVKGLVEIGFELRKIEDGRLYTIQGYRNINEFAADKLHYERTFVSKLKKLNEAYSEGGYSNKVRGDLRDKLEGLGKTALIEMMYLPEDDYELITPATPIEDIRALNNAEKQQRREGQATGQTDILSWTPEAVPESEKPKKEAGISDVIRELFHPREMKEHLDSLINMDPDSNAMEWWVSDFNQSGNRTFKKMPFFIFFYPLAEGVKIRNIKEQTTESKTYREFYFMVCAAFGEETAKGTDVWNQAFGEEWKEQKEKESVNNNREYTSQHGGTAPSPEEKEDESTGEETAPSDRQPPTTGTHRKEPEPDRKTPDNTAPEVVSGEVEDKEPEEKPLCDTAQAAESFNREDDYDLSIIQGIIRRIGKVKASVIEGKWLQALTDLDKVREAIESAGAIEASKEVENEK